MENPFDVEFLALLTIAVWATLLALAGWSITRGQSWSVVRDHDGQGSPENMDSFRVALAFVVCAGWGISLPFNGQPSIGFFTSILLLPVLLREAFRLPRYRKLIWISSIFTSLLLLLTFTKTTVLDSHQFVQTQFITSFIPLVSVVLAVLTIHWASRVIGWRTAFCAYFMTFTLWHILFLGAGVEAAAIAWKYEGLAFALTTLGFLLTSGSRSAQLAVGFTSVAVSLLAADYRSGGLAVLLAILASSSPATAGWRRLGRHARWVALVVLAPLVYLLSHLILSKLATWGLLGASLQQRVLDVNPDLTFVYLGDRVGFLIGLDYALANPMGMGMGVAANVADYNVLASSLLAMGRQTDGFANEYLLGYGYQGVPRLHSLLGDLGVWLGLLGLAVALLLLLMGLSVLNNSMSGLYSDSTQLIASTSALFFVWDFFGSGGFGVPLMVTLFLWAESGKDVRDREPIAVRGASLVRLAKGAA